ncbi:mRNA turnover protein 4 [Fasciola hepatica]|uniref:mRNA turnover protein 4 n=1 Tax=Fasciola hepatica TaxID=6192 RepID=A0A4E0RHX9_FASHE|nr:mRNA turnover protein 4 [Fasciola hepatica]
MPSSRRDKKVDLTKVGRKPAKKAKQIDRKYLSSYSHVFIIRFVNPRNQKIAELRKGLADAQYVIISHVICFRVIFGKNKVTALALTLNLGKKHLADIEKLLTFLRGQCAVLLTNNTAAELRTQFDAFRSSEFARPGCSSPQRVILAAGELSKFPHTMEPYLRQLGVPVKLVRGVVHLTKNFKICEKGETLKPEQCRILKLFDIELAEFRVSLVASWSAEAGVTSLEEADSFEALTSLPDAVRVVCRKLDDGQFYFIPEPDTSELGEEPEDMEQ